jgi:hypothetical protein
MNLSPNFTLAELIHTDHRELENVPNETEIQNLYRLAQFLEKVKSLLGDRPIMVNSAFRSKAVNDAVGSKDTSQHRLGCAADIRVPGMSPEDVCKAIYESDLGYDQLIKEFVMPTGGGWTHVSIPNTAVLVARGQALVIDRLGTRAYA